MNLDQIQGVAKVVTGKLQEELGTLLDDPEYFVQGVRKQIAGRRQKGRGDMQQAIEEFHARQNRSTH
jgi:uncharacterized protein YjbJ (UPF0337 family)